MLDFSHLPTSPLNDAQIYTGEANTGWRTWVKPRGCSVVMIFALGAGGAGGNGVVGAASTAAGGGGGASGGQITWIGPALLLPDVLFVNVDPRRAPGTPASFTRISITPEITQNNLFLAAVPGGGGGNAAGATAGIAGVAGAAPGLSLLGIGTYTSVAGNPGTAGGTTGAAPALTLPISGNIATGGTGGAGVGTAASAGTNGGSITGAGIFPTHTGGIGSAGAAGQAGKNGIQPISKVTFFYGGTGGGSAAASGTFSGGPGGQGAPGAGGGGGGGSFTGGVAQSGGFGGPGLVIILAW